MKASIPFLIFLAIGIVIAGCGLTDPDWQKLADAVDHMDDIRVDGQGFNPRPSPVEYWIDSASHLSDTSLLIHGHLGYDSVLVIVKTSIKYWEDTIPLPPEVKVQEIILFTADTVDFRTLPVIRNGSKNRMLSFKIQISSLRAKTLYRFCSSGEFLVRLAAEKMLTCSSYSTR